MNEADLKRRLERGDAWATLSADQTDRLAAEALAGMSQRKTQRGLKLMLGLGAAFALSSAALAAVAWSRAGTPPPPAPQQTHAPAVSPTPPSPPPVVESPPAAPLPAPPAPKLRTPAPAPSTLGAESKLLMTALRQLRVEADPDAALATLDDYEGRFPAGALKKEAAAAREEALTLKSKGAVP